MFCTLGNASKGALSSIDLHREVLHMEGVNAVLGIVKNDLVGYEKQFEYVRRAQMERGSQTCHRAKHNDTAY